MKNELDGFKKTICHTCDNTVYMTIDMIPECQNCYITKLELMEKDKQDERKQGTKVISIKRRENIQS